jgi:hypothetical protein
LGAGEEPRTGIFSRLESGAADVLRKFIQRVRFVRSLRRIDSPQLVGTLSTTQLALDSSVWSLGSSIFNPPNLSGLVTERTTLEAMITHSDNTATDMTLKHVGANRVRDFISSIGLPNTRIPNSTRQFLGYIFGASDWQEYHLGRDCLTHRIERALRFTRCSTTCRRWLRRPTISSPFTRARYKAHSLTTPRHWQNFVEF